MYVCVSAEAEGNWTCERKLNLDLLFTHHCSSALPGTSHTRWLQIWIVTAHTHTHKDQQHTHTQSTRMFPSVSLRAGILRKTSRWGDEVKQQREIETRTKPEQEQEWIERIKPPETCDRREKHMHTWGKTSGTYKRQHLFWAHLVWWNTR